MARARSLAEFQKSFSDEKSCSAFLFKRRWPDGFVCPGCGKRRAVGLKSRPRLHECLDCGRQTSVTAGTTMHRSKLPLTAWFWAAHLMTTHSNGMSALPWSHRAFSLLKRWTLGTYHGLRRKHVDTYLNEFVFRYNRRFYRHASFETLLALAAHHEPASYWNLIGRANPRKGNVPLRRAPRRRKPAAGMRQDSPASAQPERHQPANAASLLELDKPGTTQYTARDM